MENLQSVIYQKQYQEVLKKQLDGLLDNLQGEEFTSISEYLESVTTIGYIGTNVRYSQPRDSDHHADQSRTSRASIADR